jgi:predicted GNAT family acetyltransferase
MYDDLPIVNNQAAHNFEMVIEGQRAFIDYIKRDDVYLLVHTEVPEQLAGKGVASAMVEKTFKYLDAHHFKIKAYCQYVQAYLKRHPEWEKLIVKQFTRHILIYLVLAKLIYLPF